jgi:hypothetical protein
VRDQHRSSIDHSVTDGRDVDSAVLRVGVDGNIGGVRMCKRSSPSHNSTAAQLQPPPPPIQPDISYTQEHPLLSAVKTVQMQVENISILHTVLKAAGTNIF